MKSLLLFLIVPFSMAAQPKKTNTIEIEGVSFSEVANALMDAGFTLEKVDSNFQTIRTDFKEGSGKTKWMKVRYNARVKDSNVILTGEWYNSMFMGSKIIGQEGTLENSVFKIENASVNPKNCFKDMNTFALAFGKPVKYFTR